MWNATADKGLLILAKSAKLERPFLVPIQEFLCGPRAGGANRVFISIHLFGSRVLLRPLSVLS